MNKIKNEAEDFTPLQRPHTAKYANQLLQSQKNLTRCTTAKRHTLALRKHAWNISTKAPFGSGGKDYPEISDKVTQCTSLEKRRVVHVVNQQSDFKSVQRPMTAVVYNGALQSPQIQSMESLCRSHPISPSRNQPHLPPEICKSMDARRPRFKLKLPIQESHRLSQRTTTVELTYSKIEQDMQNTLTPVGLTQSMINPLVTPRHSLRINTRRELSQRYGLSNNIKRSCLYNGSSADESPVNSFRSIKLAAQLNTVQKTAENKDSLLGISEDLKTIQSNKKSIQRLSLKTRAVNDKIGSTIDQMKFDTLNISDKDYKQASHLNCLIKKVLPNADYQIKKNVHLLQRLSCPDDSYILTLKQNEPYQVHLDPHITFRCKMLVLEQNAPLNFDIKYFSPGTLHFAASFRIKEPSLGNCDTGSSGRLDRLKVPCGNGHPRFCETTVYLTFLTHNQGGLRVELTPSFFDPNAYIDHRKQIGKKKSFKGDMDAHKFLKTVMKTGRVYDSTGIIERNFRNCFD